MNFLASFAKFLRAERKELRNALIAVAIIAFIVKGIEFYGWLGSAEGLAIDKLLGPKTAKRYLGPRIAVLEIDEETYRSCFASTSPLRPDIFLKIVEHVVRMNPKPAVVGVDVLTEGERPGYDAAYRAWKEQKFSRISVPIVWAAGGNPSRSDRPRDILDWMNGRFFDLDFEPSPVLGGAAAQDPSVLWAIPAYPREDDGVVRRIPATIDHNGMARYTWAVRVAACALNPNDPQCTNPNFPEERGTQGKSKDDELFLSYGKSSPEREPPFDILYTRNYFQCTPGNPETISIEPKSDLPVGGKLVLVGGHYGRGDMHDTPGNSLPGIEINAYAVQDELAGSGIKELNHWWAALADIGVGMVVSCLFLYRKSKQDAKHLVRYLMLVNITAFITLLSISRLLFSLNILWVSWVGMLVSLVIAFLVDMWRENPEVSSGHSQHSS
jgi:hypothetical protein